MKLFARIFQQNLLPFAAWAFLLCAAQVFAVSPSEINRVLVNNAEHGLCCSSWNFTVQVTEPKALKPVVVTWDTDFVNSNPEHWTAGLIVNNKPCGFYGAGDLTNQFGSALANAAFQWVIFPQDGLVAGTNTFTVCGGSITSSTDSIGIGFNTLAARAVGVSASQLQRILVNQVFTGNCCFSWGEKIQVNEPKILVPVVVTWSFDLPTTDHITRAGVSVNGGLCTTPWQVDQSSFLASTAEFVVYPSDGLVQGKNTITLCGGDAFGNNGSLGIGPNTLAVHISN